jgi:hypothetical protein
MKYYCSRAAAHSILVTKKVGKQRSQGQFGTEKESKNSSARGSIHEENRRLACDARQDTHNWKNGRKFNRVHRSVNELLTSAHVSAICEKDEHCSPDQNNNKARKMRRRKIRMGNQPL